MIVPDRWRWATTDGLGKFELLGVMPGSHEVHIEHPRYADKDVRVPHEPEGAEAAVTLDVRLRRVPGGRVSGRVTDREGSPLPGVEVSDADRASAESDAQGRFVLEYVQGATPVRQFALTARKKGFFEDGGQFLGAAADDVTLELWPLPKWSGQVLSPEGLPVKQFRVQFAPLDDSDVEQVIVRDYAEAEGRFTLDFEQAGPHWLAIQAEGYAAWEKTIKVGKEPQSLDVRLDRGVTVTGQVWGPLRRPRQVQVVLVPEKERGRVFQWRNLPFDRRGCRQGHAARLRTDDDDWTTPASSASNTYDPGPTGWKSPARKSRLTGSGFGCLATMSTSAV